jgi:hypothetical protein
MKFSVATIVFFSIIILQLELYRRFVLRQDSKNSIFQTVNRLSVYTVGILLFYNLSIFCIFYEM